MNQLTYYSVEYSDRADGFYTKICYKDTPEGAIRFRNILLENERKAEVHSFVRIVKWTGEVVSESTQ